METTIRLFFLSTASILTRATAAASSSLHIIHIQRETPPPLLSPLAYFPQRCLTTSTLNSSVWEQFPERNTLPPSRQHVVLQRRFTEDSSPECDDTETRGEFRQSPGSGGRATPICERCVDHEPKTTGKLNAFFFISVSGMSFFFFF